MSEQHIADVESNWPGYESVTIRLGIAESISRSLLVQPGGNLKVRNWRLRDFIADAYNIQTHEIQSPDWLDAQFINIDARMKDPPSGPDHIKQFHLMMRRILAEQFGLTFHRETRQMPVYALIAESKSQIEEARPGDPGPLLRREPNGITLHAAPMELFSRFVSKRLGRPLLDQTGLTATYNFSFNWVAESTPTETVLREPTESGLRDALEKIGLRLVDQSADVEMMVIDHIQLPADIVPAHSTIPMAPEQFDRFVGHYDFPNDCILTVYREGDKFFTQVTGQRPVEICAESDYKFFAPVVDAQFTFICGSKDRVAQLELRQSGHNITAKLLDERTAQQRAEKLVNQILRQMAAPGRSAADSESVGKTETPTPIDPD
ncbi:MAG: TIGR03435 family protein [Acidobacteria bacterium]|nr:TIGR03435 family protein [Acidobacteriota bacterium]